MGDGFWVSGDTAPLDPMLRGLVGGFAYESTGKLAIPLTGDASDAGTDDAYFGQALRDVNMPMVVNSGFTTGDHWTELFKASTDYKIADFGLMRACMQAYSNTRADGNDVNYEDKIKFTHGPFLRAAIKLEPWWSKASTVWTDLDAQKITASRVVLNSGGSVVGEMTLGDLVGNRSDKSWLAQGLSQLVDSDLIIESGGGDAADTAVGMYSYVDTIATALDEPEISYDVEAAYTVPVAYTPPAAYTVGAAYTPGQLTDLFSEWTIQGPSVWGDISVTDALDSFTTEIEDDFTIATTLAKQTVTALGAYLTADPTITAPAIVEVEDNIDDAVEAYSAGADLRYAEEEGRIRASLYGARAHMSTYMENTLQLLAAKKQAEIAEFESNLRVEQTRQKMQVGLEYQKQTLDKNTTLANLKLDGEKADLQAHVAWIGNDVQAGIENQRNNLNKDVQERTLLVEAQKAAEANLIAMYDLELKRLIAKSDVLVKGDTIKADAFMRITAANAERNTAAAVAKWQEDLQANIAKWGADEKAAIAFWQEDVQSAIVHWQETNRANAAGMEADLKLFDSKVSILDAIYRAVIGTISLKAQNLGNAGAVVNLLQSVIDNNLKATDSYRNYLLNFEKTRYGLATEVSGAIANVAELRWKAQIQNMMVIKEAMSAIGAAPQGVEHHPSGFQKITDTLGAGLGAGAGIMNIVTALS
jgi:hypothetical protein